MSTPDPKSRRGGRRYSRADHRARSHDSAHSGEGDAPPQDQPHPGPDHPLVPRGHVPLITGDAELAALLDRLRASGSFAYDSEFIGELTYHPKLCLIQVASATEVALIDPIADVDLRPFWELLCDPAVEKIVHAGDQDVEPVVRHLGRGPANLFDTQIAAGLAGLPYPVSLSKLVMELTGARIGKGLTFTHWDQRPLSNQQLRYAADDVRYLPLVRQAIGKRLESLGHAGWAREECEAMCEPSQYRFDPGTAYARVRGSGSLQPRNLAVLRALVAWRDAAARAEDVPPRTFLRDEVMIDLSRNPAKSPDRLARVKGLPRPVEHEHGKAIVEATLAALAQPASDLPEVREVEPSPAERFRADALWSAAQALCTGRGIDPALVCSRQELGEFWQRLRDGASPEDTRLYTGWRRAALGEPLAQLVAGTASFTCRWADGLLKASLDGNG